MHVGIALDWLQRLKQVTTESYFIGGSTPTTISTSQPSELQRRTTVGVVMGGGVDVRLRRLHVEPEVRYTWWTQRHFEAPSALFFVPPLQSNADQVEVLLGITF